MKIIADRNVIKAISIGHSLELWDYTIKKNGIVAEGEEISCYVCCDNKIKGEFSFSIGKKSSEILILAIDYYKHAVITIDTEEKCIFVGKIKVLVYENNRCNHENMNFSVVGTIICINSDNIKRLLRNKATDIKHKFLFIDAGKCYTTDGLGVTVLPYLLDTYSVAIPIAVLKLVEKAKVEVVLGVDDKNEYAVFLHQEIIIKVKLSDIHVSKLGEAIEKEGKTFTITIKEFKTVLSKLCQLKNNKFTYTKNEE